MNSTENENLDVQNDVADIIFKKKLMTLTNLLEQYRKIFGRELPLCGYMDIYLLIWSWYPCFEITYNRDGVACIKSNTSSTLNHFQDPTQYRVNGSTGTYPRRPNPEPPAPPVQKVPPPADKLDKTKKEIRALFGSLGVETIEAYQLIRDYRTIMESDIPLCGYQHYRDLFNNIPDVLIPIPNSDSYKLVPSKRSLQQQNVINATKNNSRERRNQFNRSRLKEMDVQLGRR